APRKSSTHAARHEQVADVDLVGPLHELDATGVPRLIAGAANEPSGAGQLVDDVDAAAAVDRQKNVDAITRDALHLTDGALLRDDGHVGTHFATGAIHRNARYAEKFGDVLADHLGAHEIAGYRFFQAEQAFEASVFDFLLLESPEPVAQARVFVEQPLVV